MSNVNPKGRRSIKSNQLGMREVVVTYTGASGDAVSGPDSEMVTVTDNATGNYTIVLNSAARSTYGNDCFIKGFTMITENTTLVQEAVDDDRVTVQCRTIAGTPADADADFVIVIGVHDWRFKYA